MTKKELQAKFYYVQVSSKYDILRAAELLKEIDVDVLPTDEQKMKVLNIDDSSYSETNSGTVYLMKDNQGWKIQSHFIASDNTMDELKECIEIYTRKRDRENMPEEDREKCEKKISKFYKDIEAFMCYFYNHFDNDEDIKEVQSKFNYFFETLSKRYAQDFKSFKKDKGFKSKLESFKREHKINQLT